MSEPGNDRRAGSGATAGGESRSSGSLTDAVVAALANVHASQPEARPQPAPEVAAAPPQAAEVAQAATVPQAAAAAQADPDAVVVRSIAIATGDAPPDALHGEGFRASEPERPVSDERTLPEAPLDDAMRDAAAAAGLHVSDPSPNEVPEGLVVRYFGRTDVGLVREHNEDNFLVADLTQRRRGTDGVVVATNIGDRGLVLAVCDGMGGAAAGEVASQMAVDTIHEMLQAGGPPRDRDRFARRLVRAIEEAGSRIFSAAKMDRGKRGMGTTSTVAGLVDSTLFVGQVGDSRAYVLRGDRFALITKDQSLVNQLIEAGQLTEEEAEAFEHSNIILQALGTTEEVTVDLTFLELRRGDRLVVCSDGLSGLVHADMIRDTMRDSHDLSEAAQQLIALANAGGGHDNITVVCAEFDGTALRERTPEAGVGYQQYPLPPEEPGDEEPPTPRAQSIKSGGPKPGADVKSDGESGELSVNTGSARTWMFLLLVVAILLGVGAILALAGGEEETSAAEPARVTIATAVGARPRMQNADVARVVVRTDAEGGELYVDGARRTEIARADGTRELALAPGSYRLELRRGEARVAEETLTLQAGQARDVDLSMPAGAATAVTAEVVAGEPPMAAPVADDPGANAAAPSGY